MEDKEVGPNDERQQKKVITCAICFQSLNGAEIRCEANVLYHTKCYISSECPKCSQHRFQPHMCASCKYTRKECALCHERIDIGVFYLDQILCDACYEEKPRYFPYVKKQKMGLIR